MKPNILGRASLCAFAAAGMLALTACTEEPSSASPGFAPGDPGTESIVALISGSEDLSAVDALMKDAGLSQAFDGMAAYTIFAPTNDAITALGESFTGPGAQPALVAVLRQHIVPGYLTVQDLASAIESSGGPVEMQTMGASSLTFAMDGDTLTVSTGDGATPVTITEEYLGVNGVVLPVGTVLKDIEAET